ncbi:MAG: PIN domain-containing protein [Prosthecobacter sp.]|jgi:tRNA(fMet)-specific endonuclease VapC|uniref:PIN domain-containing protein n=1 Tax=Prosthecobacter sp. TaxID=1965333 RepID=UPI001A069B07|nr:PIN domain-containing protein [Prosthecobacter sp.]MBE2284193.1 PIN domain-containing protein [Prosthecobacter sp.]
MKAPGSLALDSSVIVRHMRTGDVAIASRLKAATELYLPLTALGEMRFGIQRVGNSRRAVEQWERFSREVVVLQPDDATATAYAELKQALAAKGRPIPENDLWIAATAKSHGLPLYCMDAHFDELAEWMTIIQA